MIGIDDLLAEEAQLRKSTRPSKSSGTILLTEQEEEAAIKVISRERLLRYDGEELVAVLCRSLTGREATRHEKLVLARRLRAGETTKRYIYDVFLSRASYDWQRLSGTGWLLNQAAAETLTLGEWLSFSLRFMWFRIGTAFRKTRK